MALVHTASPELRDRAVEVQTPYWGALTLGILAASLGRLSLFYGSGALLSLGNIHLVRTLLGDLLRAGGMSELHLICLGLGLTLLQATLVRRLVRQDQIAQMAARSCLVWAALILALLSANYLVHPNLESIGGFRFGVSGALSLLAGWYFRWAARHPAPGEERTAIWCEGFYHFGTTMALWCAALLVPALRHPVTALVALGLPVLYFYGRAEWGRSERYLNSAATLGFLVLSLYVLRPVFQMILFPEAPFETEYYHRNSPCIFVLGMILLRLRALGGTSWLAFYGGLAVMGSVYFALTALPGMSPFHHPVESAWCALALAHFFTLASAQRSPLRTAIQRLAGIDVPEWQALRRPWGVCLLVASQGMALYGLLEYGSRPLMVAPLLVGAASVWIHQGTLRGSTAYAVVGRVLFVLALHAGLVVPSYLPATHILWALVGLWAAILALDVAVPVPGMAGDAATLFVLSMAQVLFQHHPHSISGLWGAALAAGLAALTPRPSRSPGSTPETLAAASLPWAPAWLVGWSQASIPGAWPVLAASGAVLLTGVAAGILGRFMTRDPWAAGRLRARLFDQSLSFLRSRGRVVFSAALGVSFLTTLIVLGVHPRGSFGIRELWLSEGLCVAFLAGWIVEGLSRRTMAPFFLAQASALAGFLALRSELLVPLHGWRPEYDLWVSLGVFLVFSAMRERLDSGRRHVLIPVQVGLLGLPAFSLAWSLLHPVGAEFALLLVGLHSAAFAFLGRDDRESPYHLVAIGGAVTFACVLFWSKLHLREVYAYVEPVGLGVLVLVQLFARKVAPEVRTGVRATALVGMLGSVGYYCLMDRGIPVANHLVLIVLCLALMGLGGLLRIRLYLALGFGALMADLLALFVKMVAHMERSVKMTLVGSMVLAMGAALVFGAIWVKTHQKELAAGLERWRLRFSGWE
jgi:hypothetical protein